MRISLANDLIFRELDTIDAFDVSTGDYLFSLEELSDYSINHTEESQDILGRNGRVISRIKRNKGVTISGTNGVVSAGLFSMQTGGTYSNEPSEIMWVEYLKVKNNTASIGFEAVGTVGSEIYSLVVRSRSGEPVQTLVQGVEASDGIFTYNPQNKKLTFYGIDDGTEIAVYYKRFIQTTTLINSSNKYSGRAMLYVNGLAEDKCSNLYRVQFYFPSVDFSGEFSIELGNGQTVHKFEAVALSSLCGGEAKYYSYSVFGINEGDSDISGVCMYIGSDDMYYVGTDSAVYVSEST